MFSNTGEPFGLPQGTVRGIIALVCLGLLVWDFYVDQAFSVELLAFAGPYLGFYFADRQANTAAARQLASAEVLDPPAGEGLGD
jgi:hypothetical protein